MALMEGDKDNIIPHSAFVQFKEFQEEMLYAIKGHYPDYGDSWKKMSIGKLNDRMKHKYSEFELTNKPSKLISLANLAMLLYIRLKENPPKTQSPEELI